MQVQLVVLILCALLVQPALSNVNFYDVETVRDVAADFMVEFHCGCVVILKPNKTTNVQGRFIDQLTYSIARTPLQVMAYNMDDYVKYYTDESRRNTGSCFKWLTIVMVADSTGDQLEELSQSHVFNQCVWLLFPNDSLGNLFEGVKLWYNSAVWLAQQATDGFALSEVYQVDTGFPIRVKSSGTWTNSTRLNLFRSLKQYRPRDMEGRMLVASAKENWPIFSFKKKKNPADEVDGYFVNVWNELETCLNFTTTIRGKMVSQAGSLTKDGKRRSGVLEMIQSGEADVAMSEVDYSAARLEFVEFMLPLLSTEFQVYYKSEGTVFDWKAVFRPFHSSVWLTLLGWICLGSVALYFCSFISTRNGLNESQEASVLTSAFFVLQSLCVQGSSTVPKLWGCRILFVVCYLTAAVILPSYSASLISSLTKKTPDKPLDNLKDILKTDYKIHISPNTSFYEYFANSPDADLQRILKDNALNDTEGKIHDYDSGLEYICSHSRVALFSIEGAIADRIQSGLVPRDCQLLSLSEKISSVSQSMAFVKHSPYVSSANYFIFRMKESGILNRIRQKYWGKTVTPAPKTPAEINIIEVAEIFIFLVAAQVLSLIILFFEIRLSKSQKRGGRSGSLLVNPIT